MAHTRDIVQKLWNLCNILKDDGITYQDYVTELTYLLFLKMAHEIGKDDTLPKGYRWVDLERKDGVPLLIFYRRLLLHLGTRRKGRVQEIFADANTSLRQPRHLKDLVTQIDAIEWFEAREEGTLAELYEGLLEKNAQESKSGAGQYFTPRPLIDCMVELIQPRAGELVQDPACGTAGFLIAADRYIKQQTDGLSKLKTALQDFQIHRAFVGVELVPDTHRHALMNAMLHGIYSPLILGDTLGATGEKLEKADVILTNPPFGTKKGGGLPSRTDFTYRTSNKQLCFLQHIYRGLQASGRAAVVLPDNVLFEAGVGKDIRKDLMEKCNLHTILRLPTGIFYAQGVKTNVLFFTRGTTDKGNTKEVWVYDLRANMPQYGKRTPLTREHFREFEKAFGHDPLGNAASLKKRKGTGKTGRFRKFSREWIAQRDDSLDIGWLKEDDGSHGGPVPEPAMLATSAMQEMEVIMENLRGILIELGEDVEESVM
jgi:type I restriction enzyme M protein